MCIYVQQNIIEPPKGGRACIYDTAWIYLENIVNNSASTSAAWCARYYTVAVFASAIMPCVFCFLICVISSTYTTKSGQGKAT